MAAGYDALFRGSGKLPSGGSATECNVTTLESRAMIGRKVLEKNGWILVADPMKTRGNLATYEWAGKLTIITPFGIDVIQDHLIGEETKLGGSLSVNLDGAAISTATVTINGVNVPYTAGPFGQGAYELGASGATVNPGDKITLVARLADPPISASITVTCPPALKISSPAEGSVNRGAPLKVAWSPAISIVPMFTFTPAPVAGQYAAMASVGTFSRLGTGDGFKALKVGQTEVTLTDVIKDCDISIIEVRSSSEIIMADDSIAICYLHARVKQVRGK
jgi:hypothetical protein